MGSKPSSARKVAAASSGDGVLLCPSIEKMPAARGSREEQKDHKLPAYELRGPLKCALLGDEKVGKTAFLQAVFKNELVTEKSEYICTIGVDFAIVYAALDPQSKTRYLMQVWDLSGAERFRAIAQAYFRGTTIFFLCFDLSRPETLKCLETDWMPKLERREDALYYLVGCKADKENAQLGLGKAYAEELKVPYIETSSVTGGNIAEACVGALRDKFQPGGRLPWDGPSLEDYLQMFDAPVIQTFFQRVAGFTKPRTGLQLIIAEYAMNHRGYHSAVASVFRTEGNGTSTTDSPPVSSVPRRTEPWYAIY